MIEEIKNAEEKYRALPRDIQQALVSVQVHGILQEISKKYRLHIDQEGDLFDETGLIMFGIIHPKDYIRNLQKRLNIDTDTAKKIAVDVNEQIFRPIRESLKKIHSIGNENQEPKIKNREEETQKTELAEKPITLNAKPLTPNTEQKEHPILRLKKYPITATEPVEQKQGLGWPVRRETGIINKELGIRNQEPARPTTSNNWEPKQPGKEMLAPQNLPIETEKDKAPMTGMYPLPEKDITKDMKPPETPLGKIIPGKEPRVSSKVEESVPEIKQVSKDGVGEKLSASFKIPRAETEYREKRINETAKKQGYANADPYREPTN